MAATAVSTVVGTTAPTFRLPATDGKTYALDDIAGTKGTVIVFICNHCPYVKAVIDRLVGDAKVLMAEGIGFAAICSNDAKAYPADFFENMQRFAKTHGFPFPYLHDDDQSVARGYGASARRIFSAMTRSASSGIAAASTRVARPRSPRPRAAISWRPCARSRPAKHRRSRFPSVGCSIKWKAA